MKQCFTLVEIMIVVAIIGVLAVIAIPNFIAARASAQSTACINNMKMVENAVQVWALETKKAPGTELAGNEDAIAQYIKGQRMPICPAGESSYTLAGTVDQVQITCANQDKPRPGLHRLPPPASSL